MYAGFDMGCEDMFTSPIPSDDVSRFSDGPLRFLAHCASGDRHNLPQNLYVRVTAGYVALGYIVVQITYFGVYCQPFSQYWAFPVSNLQCATYSHYSITQAVFNISSDAMMLAIPIPILLKVQLPRSRCASCSVIRRKYPIYFQRETNRKGLNIVR